jgi:hypothetical protein
VAVGVCQKDGGSGVSSPCVFQSTGPEAEGDDAGQCPDRLNHRYQCPFISPFTKLCDSQQRKNMENLGGNDK